jgi:serine/threonine-protein phosphatase 5
MLDMVGAPSSKVLYIFNGDFVDRGAWGMETLVLLCCLKLAMPMSVFMLRGNHESATCAIMYGFKGEIEAKYGKKSWRSVFAACKKLFAALPLAARVAQSTLVLHGGLFRPLPSRGKRKRESKIMPLGRLDDLRRSGKGGLDPSGLGASRLATDVLWSDPMTTPGFEENTGRGIGLVFGPDVTERFLRENDLKLILRSHEGPDARADRPEMGSMLEGWTEDHVTPAGRLMTVFSAPDYPQFLPDDAERYRNKAAVAILSAPDFATPVMKQFEAALPRPEATPYYDLFVNDSDEEYEAAPSTASGMTDVAEERGRGREVAFEGGADSEKESEQGDRTVKRQVTEVDGGNPDVLPTGDV